MKTITKRKTFIIIFGLLFCIVFCLFGFLGQNTMNANAQASTAAAKGFRTDTLTYLDDQDNENVHIATSNYDYGTFSMWSACYKYLQKEPDNTTTCYYYALVESSICSKGKYGKYRFFRNKFLDVSIDFYSQKGNAQLINFTPQSSDSTTGSSVGFGIDGSVGTNMQVGGSISYTETVTYDTVNLTLNSDTLANNRQVIKYHYKFMHWDNGAMVAPNVGLVQKRMVVIFAVENYAGEDFSMQIETEATIFKDATWPRKNATLSGKIVHSY